MLNMDVESDKPLVEACINKDALAWERLVRRHFELILASIKNRLRRYGFDPACEDTEDIRQDVVAAIWRENKLESVRNRDNIACWLSIVSGNMAILHMRKKLPYAPRPMPIADETDEDNSLGAAFDKTDICESLDRKEARRWIEESINALPTKEKLVVKLHLLYGKKFHEVAEILHMPIGTVSSHAKRAKTKLREKLKYLQ